MHAILARQASVDHGAVVNELLKTGNGCLPTGDLVEHSDLKGCFRKVPSGR
jgi:hypothetical protein